MKILVTGGAGFIGSHVVDAMLADGHDVVVVDDLSTGRQQNLNPKARFYQLDIRDPGLAAVFERERPEIVDHHAAQLDVSRSVAEPLFDADVKVRGTCLSWLAPSARARSSISLPAALSMVSLTTCPATKIIQSIPSASMASV